LRTLTGSGAGTEQGETSKRIWFLKEVTDTANIKEMVPYGKSIDLVTANKDSTEAIPGDSKANPTLSPEVFITDDNIVNTQESGIVEDVMMKSATNNVGNAKEDLNKQVSKPVQHTKEKDQQVTERRRSERLKKDTNQSTKEKTEKMALKRNLEGNPIKSNSFFVLPIEDIVHISTNMGIAVSDYTFDTFDLIKDLEKARDDLYLK
jgi:hypothetical protein